MVGHAKGKVWKARRFGEEGKGLSSSEASKPAGRLGQGPQVPGEVAMALSLLMPFSDLTSWQAARHLPAGPTHGWVPA